MVGDKGYIGKDLFGRLFARGLRLITRVRSNMRNRLMPLFDKLLIRKRAIIETIIDQLKQERLPSRTRAAPEPGELLRRRDRRPRRLHVRRQAPVAQPPAGTVSAPRRGRHLIAYAELTWNRNRSEGRSPVLGSEYARCEPRA